MSLVYAGTCCHAPGITSRPDMAEATILQRIHDAFARQRRAIEAADAEALVLVSSEHFANFFMDNMPTFSIGMADESYYGPIEDPEWLQIQPTQVPANPDLSLRLIREVMKTVDVGYAQEFKFDHGLAVPLHFLTPDYKTPIVPVNINCQCPPLPPLDRTWALGEALRSAIDAVPEKVALIGTGGTSHWPCTPDSGKINDDWDNLFLNQIVNKNKDALLAYSDVETLSQAGQGALELRTSICIAGATQDQVGQLWLMEPVPIFATSCSITTLFQS